MLLPSLGFEPETSRLLESVVNERSWRRIPAKPTVFFMSENLLIFLTVHSPTLKIVFPINIELHNEICRVQSWKAAHLPTLEIRVEQKKGNRTDLPRCFQ